MSSIIVVDYDPAWPQLFIEEQTRIRALIGEYVTEIEHIGSTSIPGLAAKPIIDILLVIRSYSLVAQCVQPLESIGYEYRGEAGIPGRHFFRKFSPTEPPVRTHHIHMIEKSNEQYAWNLLFREYLRRHPETVQEYAVLKRELVVKYRDDRAAYTDAKAPFVYSTVRKAVLEALEEMRAMREGQ